MILKKTNCPICSQENLKFLTEYKLEIKEDYKYFKNLKILKCDDCDFSFADPMPKKTLLYDFYKNIYRSPNRPPYWFSNEHDDLKNYLLDDKNMNYLCYLTSLLDISKFENVYDFGAGYGDLGFLLKKKFPKIKLFCTENDKHCEKILFERNYINFKSTDDIDKKFDLIISLHSLEHMSDINIFSKFYNILNQKGFIFFEVPNCTKEYFSGRPYDSPHLLFYTKKSIEKIASLFNLELVNLSFSSYSFTNDHKFQKESQDLYTNLNNSIFSYSNLKNKIKRFTPQYLINLKKKYFLNKKFENEERINWFANNVGDNCYVRAIMYKK